ncbi:MAG: TetR/AcrR family transcriptional regulator [Solobacterium sp.]|nr:TetR/AcrR family transcriptional regulator [Solobacterium sp.]
MPKLIDQAKNKILDSAERILREEGYRDLTIRKVAADCSIAIGTIYNYFPNKKDLVDSILRREWERLLVEIEKLVAENHNPVAAILLINDTAFDYLNDYHVAIPDFSDNIKHQREMYRTREAMIRGISYCIGKVFEKTGYQEDPEFIRILSTSLLNSVYDKETHHENMRILLERVYGNQRII